MHQSGAVKPIDDALAELTEIYLEAARKDVGDLEALVARALDHPDQWTDVGAEMRRIVHNVKGQGSSFGYPLMTKIGESLSHLLKLVKKPEDPVLKLVEAHISALRLVLDQDIRDEAGAHGQALLRRFRDMVEQLAAR